MSTKCDHRGHATVVPCDFLSGLINPKEDDVDEGRSSFLLSLNRSSFFLVRSQADFWKGHNPHGSKRKTCWMAAGKGHGFDG
jgi:hypothetical protein